jgi:glutamine synthetase
VPQIAAANAIAEMVTSLQEHRDALGKLIDKAEAMHDAPAKQAELLTSAGADTMAEVRACCDALERVVSDDCWPLPKYREMLFPV